MGYLSEIYGLREKLVRTIFLLMQNVGKLCRTMESRSLLHSLPPKDSCDFHERLYIIAGVKQREFPREEEEENHTGRPDVNGA